MRFGENITGNESSALHVPDYVPDWPELEQGSENFTAVCARLMELGINISGSHMFFKPHNNESASLFVHAYPGGDDKEGKLRLIFRQTDWLESSNQTYDYLLSLGDGSMTCVRSKEEMSRQLLPNGRREVQLNSNSAPAMLYSDEGDVSLFYGQEYANVFDERIMESASGFLAGQLLRQLGRFDDENRLEVKSVNFRAV